LFSTAMVDDLGGGPPLSCIDSLNNDPRSKMQHLKRWVSF
jgi:hypothetical protein